MNIRKQNLETHPGFFKCLNTKIIAICLKFNFQKVFPASTDMDIDVTAPFLPLSPQHSWKHFFCRWDMFLSFIKIIPHISFIFLKFFLICGFIFYFFFFQGGGWKKHMDYFRHATPLLLYDQERTKFLPLPSFFLI